VRDQGSSYRTGLPSNTKWEQKPTIQNDQGQLKDQELQEPLEDPAKHWDRTKGQERQEQGGGPGKGSLVVVGLAQGEGLRHLHKSIGLGQSTSTR
jgi:hypothetical protein